MTSVLMVAAPFHPSLKMVVFDIAGTTFDLNEPTVQTFLQVAEQNRLSPSEAWVRERMGLKKLEVFQQMLRNAGFSELVVPKKASEMDQAFDLMLTGRIRAKRPRIIEGVSDLRTALLKHRIRTAFWTGYNQSLARIILDTVGWDDDLRGADRVPDPRPASGQIRLLAQKAGISDWGGIAVFDDTRYGMQAGVAGFCGWVVGVLSGIGMEQDLRAAGATHVIPSASLEHALPVLSQPPKKWSSP